jgi:hypothetical protein
MSDEKESKSKRFGRTLGKKIVEAGNIIDREIRKAGKVARDEFKEFDIGNVVVEPLKRPKNEKYVQFTTRARPTKTYTQANRTVQFFARNPDRSEINPGIDGLVSFSILIAPMAAILGLLIITTSFDEFLALILLFLYAILIAIPGAYLGIDSLLAGARLVIKGGTATAVAVGRGFAEFVYLMLLGFWELLVLVVDGLFGFAKGAFETISDYIAFIVVYLIFVVGIWFVIQGLSIQISSLVVLSFIVFLPALLPASIAHRYWFLWKINREETA